MAMSEKKKENLRIKHKKLLKEFWKELLTNPVIWLSLLGSILFFFIFFASYHDKVITTRSELELVTGKCSHVELIRSSGKYYSYTNYIFYLDNGQSYYIQGKDAQFSSREFEEQYTGDELSLLVSKDAEESYCHQPYQVVYDMKEQSHVWFALEEINSRRVSIRLKTMIGSALFFILGLIGFVGSVIETACDFKETHSKFHFFPRLK